MALEKEMISDGIDVQVSETAMSFEKDKKKIKVVTDLRTVEVDMVIFAAGFRPNTKLLQNQVTLSRTGGIVTNAFLETSQKDIFAIGDCAEVYSDLFKGGIYVPHAADAIRTGDVVAYNLLTPSRKVNKMQATMSIDMGDYYICTAGLKLEKALALGYQAKMVTFTNTHYGGDKYSAWMVYDTENHHILGM